jgi:hypothetical protein
MYKILTCPPTKQLLSKETSQVACIGNHFQILSLRYIDNRLRFCGFIARNNTLKELFSAQAGLGQGLKKFPLSMQQ